MSNRIWARCIIAAFIVVTTPVQASTSTVYKANACMALLTRTGDGYINPEVGQKYAAAAISALRRFRDYRLGSSSDKTPPSHDNIVTTSHQASDRTRDKLAARINAIESNLSNRQNGEDLVVTWGKVFEGRENIETFIHEVNEAARSFQKVVDDAEAKMFWPRVTGVGLQILLFKDYLALGPVGILATLPGSLVMTTFFNSDELLAPLYLKDRKQTPFFETVSQKLKHGTLNSEWLYFSDTYKLREDVAEALAKATWVPAERAHSVHTFESHSLIKYALTPIAYFVAKSRGMRLVRQHWVQRDIAFTSNPATGEPQLIVFTRIHAKVPQAPASAAQKDEEKHALGNPLTEGAN